ncbi:DUF4435 domain-containing protein [Clostridium perfringens]|nr:DUF4435 domain-containing protein [Clostridium perfringens]MDC4245075.1 DUF4435 domain-containing protein [Clostridium perfringens]QUD74408.1 DUF4435 domain-containing protein [Clostridium perfringens]
MLDIMEMSIKSDSVSYNEFLLRYNPKKKQIFVFYEGDEDSSYYRKFLDDYLSDEYDIEEIIAGCKNNVLKLHKEFDWEIYDSKKISFFVDRDLSFWLDDNPITEDNIFVTKGYSVENYLISKKIFRELLFNIKGFARAKNSEINNMCKYFEELLPNFKEEIKKIMAMAVLAKRRNRDIKLSEYKLSNNLKFDIVDKKVIFQLIEDNSIKEKWGIVDITDKEINDQIIKFNMHKNEYSVRGKWIIYFMVELSEFMRNNFTFFSPSLSKDNERERLKPTCNIESTKATPVLAPRCTITEELKNFMNKNYIICRDKNVQI